MSAPSVIVIGAGLVGLATAYKLRLKHPRVAVTVLEKESAPATHQSGHNSGVLHAGLGYVPGSQKARLAPAGLRQIVDFCDQQSVPYELCGKLVVAAEPGEVPRLRELLRRGQLNGLQGLAWLSPEEMREREPHVSGVAALHVPEEGIVDFPAVARALASEIERTGGRVITGAKVAALGRRLGRWRVTCATGEFESDLLINCAGLYSDRIARLAGERPSVRIVPFRGEFCRLRSDRTHLVKHLIYPVPHLAYPFLGVHLTRRIGGEVLAGPNAVLALGREGYDWSTVVLRDVLECASFPGLWRFAFGHAAMVWTEAGSSLSRRRFAQAVQRLVPQLEADDLEPGGAGVRAQAMYSDGRLVEDFHVITRPRALHVLNAPSPAATACLAIADELLAMFADQLAQD